MHVHGRHRVVYYRGYTETAVDSEPLSLYSLPS
jgi:hypothetical protein